MSIQTVEQIVKQLKSGRLSLDVVRDLTRHEAAVVRANALESLAKRAFRDAEVVEDLKRAAGDRKNRVPLMGTTRVSHVAVACLLRIGASEAAQAANQLIDDWPDSERADLLWYLDSEGLLVGEETKPPSG